jgi:hypothetical protein
MRIRENFLVGHSSQIALSQACLTCRFLRDRLPKKMYLVGIDTLLILLSLGPGYHNASLSLSLSLSSLPHPCASLSLLPYAAVAPLYVPPALLSASPAHHCHPRPVTGGPPRALSSQQGGSC